jgi:RNA polymerase sigma factor (TIGR02999 family)
VGEITELLRRARSGDDGARELLFEQLYEPLRRLAHARLSRGSRSALLDTTGLVHECFLKLEHAGALEVRDRAHLLAYAASAMRSVVVSLARTRSAERHGGNAIQVPLEETIAARDAGVLEILQVHEALERLEQVEPRLVRVVEMRYFAGMTEEESGVALDLTPRTVRRDWEKARLLLAEMLRP